MPPAMRGRNKEILRQYLKYLKNLCYSPRSHFPTCKIIMIDRFFKQNFIFFVLIVLKMQFYELNHIMFVFLSDKSYFLYSFKNMNHNYCIFDIKDHIACTFSE